MTQRRNILSCVVGNTALRAQQAQTQHWRKRAGQPKPKGPQDRRRYAAAAAAATMLDWKDRVRTGNFFCLEKQIDLSKMPARSDSQSEFQN